MEKLREILDGMLEDFKELNDKPMAIDSKIYYFDDPYPEMVQEYLATRTHDQLYNLLLEIMTERQIDDLIDRIEEEEND